MANKHSIRYLPELYYFFDSKDFRERNFLKSVLVVAKTVAQWCNYYEAILIDKKRGVRNDIKSGKLPKSLKEKYDFINKLVEWISRNSQCEDLFALFLHDKPIPKKRKWLAKFDHHDDTCCWVLNLSKKEFQQLKNNLKKNKLPEDLFYESSKVKCIPIKHKKFLGFSFESSKCYTPKQWEREKNRVNI